MFIIFDTVIDGEIQGAGARVRRSIGTAKLRNLTPFLMLDHFHVSKGAVSEHLEAVYAQLSNVSCRVSPITLIEARRPLLTCLKAQASMKTRKATRVR